jgi:hypothetical protein
MGQTWSNTSIWEVRTTGSDTNGGAFIWGASGSDYTQQNSPQYSGTDLEVNSSNNLQVKSTTAGSPVAADVGNVICISAGLSWTTGWYEIKSQDGTWWTLDRSPGTAGLTGGHFAVGGALASPGLAQWIGDNYYFYNDRRSIIYIESGTYTISTTTNGVSNRYLNSARASYIGYDQTNGRNQKPTTNPVLQSDASYTGKLAQIDYAPQASYFAGEVTWIDFDGRGYCTDSEGVVRRPQMMYQCTLRGGVNRIYTGLYGCTTIDCQFYGNDLGSYRRAVQYGEHYFAYVDAQGGGFRADCFQANGFGCVFVGTTNGGGNQYYVAAPQRQGQLLNSIIVAKTQAATYPADGLSCNNLYLSTSTSNYLIRSGSTGGTATGHSINNYHYGFNTSGGTPTYTGREGYWEDPTLLSADPCVDLAGGNYTIDPNSAAWTTLRGIPDITKPHTYNGGAMVGPGIDVTTIPGGSSSTPAAAVRHTRLK